MTQCLVLAVCMVFLFLRIHFMLKLLVACIIDAVYYYIVFHWVEVIYQASLTHSREFFGVKQFYDRAELQCVQYQFDRSARL